MRGRLTPWSQTRKERNVKWPRSHRTSRQASPGHGSQEVWGYTGRTASGGPNMVEQEVHIPIRWSLRRRAALAVYSWVGFG